MSTYPVDIKAKRITSTTANQEVFGGPGRFLGFSANCTAGAGTITFTVTVASGTNQYGTGNKFYINGEVSPVLYLQEGNTYIFDQSDSSNAVGGTHILAFSTNPNNSPAAAYTTGVTTTGTPGTAGAKTTIVVAPVRTTGAPLLFYYCTAHSGMGNTAQTISPTSGETEFNPQIDEIIEEAYERTGVLGTIADVTFYFG